eukprot:SM000109S14151  [mRNA]  locus=s109:267336:268981:- [translate_table: standard]
MGAHVLHSVPADWAGLPLDALATVFAHVPLADRLAVIPLVCKAWLRAAEAPWLYAVVHAEGISWGLGPRHVAALVRRVVALSQGQLTDLRVTHCSDAALAAVLDGCPDLVTLCLSSSHSLSDGALARLPQACVNLRHLDLSSCDSLSDGAIEAVCGLLASGPTSAHSCQHCLPDDRMLDELGDNERDSLRGGSNEPQRLGVGLERLNISTDVVRGCGGHLGGASVRSIALGCPLMRHLSIAGNKGVGDRLLTTLAEGCPLLESLDMTSCESFDQLHFQNALPLLSFLNLLDLSGGLLVLQEDPLTRQGVAAFLHKRPSLVDFIWPAVAPGTDCQDDELDIDHYRSYPGSVDYGN